MKFKIEKKLNNALGRAGVLETPHGKIHTPAFVPVGTKATIKALTPEQVADLGAEVVLGNTYHLYLQPGDEVITVANTAVPTVSAIRMVGATPRFVDIDPTTHLMDLSKVPDAINAKTKCIIPVHLFGNAVPMEELMTIATKADLYVVEDCAQAFGSMSGEKPVGSFGDIACFSFYPTKNLGSRHSCHQAWLDR